METKKADIKEIEKYDTIILGGGIYASGIAGLSFLKRNIGKLTGKKILVFCCGASPYEESAFQQCREHNMKDMLSDIPVFYACGAWGYGRNVAQGQNIMQFTQKGRFKKDPLIMKYGKRR